MRRLALVILLVLGSFAVSGCSWMCCDPCEQGSCCNTCDPCADPCAPAAQ